MLNKLLKNKKGIIFGALNEHSIAWKVAKIAYQHGASIILTNTHFTKKIGTLEKLSKEINAKIIYADATSISDLDNLFKEVLNYFNSKIDFILHSIAMSINIRKNKDYTNLDYKWVQKGLDISALSFHKIMKTAWDYNIMNKWGSIVALTYIASKFFIPYYNDMSDFKSYLESITRNFGYYWGNKNKVRVNTVSQSPTYTTASQNINNFKKFYKYSELISPLGNASSEECANYIITLFSDLTKKITMQNLYHDGGFSSTIINESFIDKDFF